MFESKTKVEKYEDQFQVKEMQNKRIFYDLYARVGDPEELRTFVNELLQDSDWKSSINELMKFEDTDTEGIFRGGKLKPLKSIIKSYKQINKGPKFPLIWKIFFFIGLGFLVFYLYTLAFPTDWNSTIIIQITPIWFIIALLIYSIKEMVSMALWVKIAGVYDIASEEADVRIVIAGDADKPDKEAYTKLQEDVSEVYNVISRKYVGSKKPITKTQIIKELKPATSDPSVSLIRTIRDFDKQIAALERKFISGEIKEDTYKELKVDLEKRKAKSETLLDLISLS